MFACRHRFGRDPVVGHYALVISFAMVVLDKLRDCVPEMTRP